MKEKIWLSKSKMRDVKLTVNVLLGGQCVERECVGLPAGSLQEDDPHSFLRHPHLQSHFVRPLVRLSRIPLCNTTCHSRLHGIRNVLMPVSYYTVMYLRLLLHIKSTCWI